MKDILCCVKKIFSLLFIVLLISGTISCNQQNNGKGKTLSGKDGMSGESEVVLKVVKDEFVASVENEQITVAKNMEISLSELKTKLGTIKFKAGYEMAKICVGNNASKTAITDNIKQTFSANSDIFIASQEKSATPILTSLKLEGVEVEIQDDIDAGYTQKKKVQVEAITSPNDAMLTFKTSGGEKLDTKNYWSINDGENKAEITVKKGAIEKKYNIKIILGEEKNKMGLNFFINRKVYRKGAREKIQREKVELLVQARKNVMAKVEIGEEGALQEARIEKLHSSKSNIDFWQASKDVALTANVEKKIVIKVTPKSAAEAENGLEYELEECAFFITGDEIKADNAQFQYMGEEPPKPRVKCEVTKWKTGCESKFFEDYGAEEVKFEVFTVSSKAHVKYHFFDPNTHAIPDNPTTYDFEHKGEGFHTSPVIQIPQDAPSAIRVFVLAEDGSSKDAIWGQQDFQFNPVELTFGYKYEQGKSRGTEYKLRAWDVVEIEKNKVTQENKVFLCLAIWNDAKVVKAFVADSSQKPQANKIGAFNTKKDYWLVPIDVKELIKDSASINELKTTITINKDEKEAFVYKVKIKVKK